MFQRGDLPLLFFERFRELLRDGLLARSRCRQLRARVIELALGLREQRFQSLVFPLEVTRLHAELCVRLAERVSAVYQKLAKRNCAPLYLANVNRLRRRTRVKSMPRSNIISSSRRISADR
jgi:hypothetical protein